MRDTKTQQIAIRIPITINMFDMKLSDIISGYNKGELVFFPENKTPEDEFINYQKEYRQGSKREDRWDDYKKNENMFLDVVNK